MGNTVAMVTPETVPPAILKSDEVANYVAGVLTDSAFLNSMTMFYQMLQGGKKGSFTRSFSARRTSVTPGGGNDQVQLL